MWHRSKYCRLLCVATSFALLFPLGSFGQQNSRTAPAVQPVDPSRELVAVLELEAAGTDRNLATALTDSLRESLLKTGRFTLVERAQIDEILKEQAFQQSGCTTQECAIRVGKVLGVRKMVSGRVVKLDDTHWRLSVSLIDVETAQAERTESVTHIGDFVSLVERGTQQLADKLAGYSAVGKAKESLAQPASSNPAWPWIVTGLFSLGLAAGAVNEAQAVTDSNAKQKELAAQAKAATTQAQYQALLNQIADQKKKGDAAATLSNELAAGSLLFAAWAIYLAVREPEKAAALRVVPVPEVSGGVRLMVVRSW